ncbi:hypothetical protein CHM_5g2850 [Cryptosporidium hominis]
MNNRYQVDEEEDENGQFGTGGLDYNKYINEQRRIEEELDNIEDDKMSRNDLLMNIKMYDDSMKEMEIMKDRLGLWKESLEGLNESIGRDGLYVKEIAIKVVERKVDELMNERKMILKKMMDKLENFTNVMKTSMDCMSNSIMDFEKKVYSSGENGDYLSFDFKSNNRICKSYFQLCQRLKEYLKNMSPYFKDNLEVDIGLNMEMNMNKGMDLEYQQFEARNGNCKSFECENGELKSIIMQESKLLREPIILLIDPKRMQIINLRNKISMTDLDEILSSSINLNPSNESCFYSKLENNNPCKFKDQYPMANANNSMNNRRFEQNCGLRPHTSSNSGANNHIKFEQERNHEKTEDKAEYSYNDEGNSYIDTDVSISIKRVKHKPGNSGQKARLKSSPSSSSSSSPRSSSSSSSRSRSRSGSRSGFKSESRTKSRSASEPRISFKKDGELKMNKIRGLVSKLESELGSHSETESRIYIRKGKSKRKGRSITRKKANNLVPNKANSCTNNEDNTSLKRKALVLVQSQNPDPGPDPNPDPDPSPDPSPDPDPNHTPGLGPSPKPDPNHIPAKALFPVQVQASIQKMIPILILVLYLELISIEILRWN